MSSSSSPSDTGSWYGTFASLGVLTPEADVAEVPFEELCKGRSMESAPVSGLRMSVSTVRASVQLSVRQKVPLLTLGEPEGN